MSGDGTPQVVVLGGGGHAGVLVDCIQARGGARILGILDSDAGRHGQQIAGIPILGGDGLLAALCDRGARAFVVGVGSARDAGPRRRLFELGLSAGLRPFSVVHPSAVCSPRCELAGGVQVLALAIVNPGARLAANVLINSGAVVEHDCRIDAHAHVASGAVLCGNVRVGTGAHIGAGAVVRQGLEIGSGAVVGCGAVVVKNVAPGAVVAGVPARPLSGR